VFLTALFPNLLRGHLRLGKMRIIKIFFIVSKAEAEEQIKNAEAAMDMIRPYLDRSWNEV